jgi:hypothetical protein
VRAAKDAFITAAVRADGADAQELNPSAFECRPGAQRRRLLDLQEQLARLPHEFSNLPAFRNSLASMAAMLERVLIASWGA